MNLSGTKTEDEGLPVLPHFVTFYSYKGGVGRTLALANVALLLTRYGRKVLVVDADLEAPGLRHIAPFGGVPQETPGFLDLLEATLSGLPAEGGGTWITLETGCLSSPMANSILIFPSRRLRRVPWDGFESRLDDSMDTTTSCWPCRPINRFI